MGYGLNGAAICLALGSVLAAIVWVLTGSLGWSGMLWFIVAFGSIPIVAYYSDPEGWRRNTENLRRIHAK
jgi:hypothetical protein